MNKVSNKEVFDLLERVGNGEITPSLVNPEETWEAVYAGEVEFNVGDWFVRVFNDCDSFNYVDFVRAPDGRTAEFEDLEPEDVEPRESYAPEIELRRRSEKCYERMIAAFKKAV